jgi:hypothetical protein
MSESMSNASIYYIPEDREPEELDSSKNSQEITFETPHFSTYAITLPGNMSEVYLDGVNGDDSNDGSSSSKEVETLERAKLMQAQTPQGFHTSVVYEAYSKAIACNYQATDDAQMVEVFSDEDVYAVIGDYENKKITTPEDLIG